MSDFKAMTTSALRSYYNRQECRLEQAKADGDERLINIITRDLECLRAEMLNRVLRAETLNQILRRKATDASLLTNGLALFGLYTIWKALCGKSRFDMPAGSGYKAAAELKGQGWDRSKK